MAISAWRCLFSRKERSRMDGHSVLDGGQKTDHRGRSEDDEQILRKTGQICCDEQKWCDITGNQGRRPRLRKEQ